jgi:hypothetical protein
VQNFTRKTKKTKKNSQFFLLLANLKAFELLWSTNEEDSSLLLKEKGLNPFEE